MKNVEKLDEMGLLRERFARLGQELEQVLSGNVDGRLGPIDLKRLASEIQSVRVMVHQGEDPSDILREDDDRFNQFPVRYEDLENLYNDAESCFWTTHDIDMTEDRRDMVPGEDGLSKVERRCGPGSPRLLEFVLGFFNHFDGIVNENIIINFLRRFCDPSSRNNYGFQLAMENIHARMYGLMIQELFPAPEDQQRIKNLIHDNPHLQKIKQWAFSYLCPHESEDVDGGMDTELPEQLLAFACIEYIVFSSMFLVAFWFRSHGVLTGFGDSNKLISKDEAKHTVTAKLHFFKFPEHRRPSTERAHRIIREIVDAMVPFVEDAIPTALNDMNAPMAVGYMRYVANHMAAAFDYSKIYPENDVVPPPSWMEMIDVDCKENFFEGRSTQYTRAKKNQTTTLFLEKRSSQPSIESSHASPASVSPSMSFSSEEGIQLAATPQKRMGSGITVLANF